LQVCDWPKNAGCEEGDGGEDGSGDNDSTLPNGCPADFDVHQLLPHEDCAKFYYCVMGDKVERDCPTGLHFNPTIQVKMNLI
jgi:hypothetical protein